MHLNQKVTDIAVKQQYTLPKELMDVSWGKGGRRGRSRAFRRGRAQNTKEIPHLRI